MKFEVVSERHTTAGARCGSAECVEGDGPPLALAAAPRFAHGLGVVDENVGVGGADLLTAHRGTSESALDGNSFTTTAAPKATCNWLPPGKVRRVPSLERYWDRVLSAPLLLRGGDLWRRLHIAAIEQFSIGIEDTLVSDKRVIQPSGRVWELFAQVAR